MIEEEPFIQCFVLFCFLSELQKQIDKVFVTNYNLGLPDGLKETVRQDRETIS